jgi:hypothetical protein
MKTKKPVTPRKQTTKRQALNTNRPNRSATAKPSVAKTSRKQHRASYPLHKRMLLHPLSIFIFLCVGVFMAGWTYHVVAATVISATIEAPPLQTAAVLQSPTEGTAFTTSSIHARGTCPGTSYVVLTNNGAFAGVAWCYGNRFFIQASLFSGTNNLVVQAYNVTDLAGPALPGINVEYTPPVPIAITRPSTDNSDPEPDSATIHQLLLTSTFQFHSFRVKKAFHWSMKRNGGKPPYQTTIDWGDGSNTALPADSSADITLDHSYDDSGYFPVTVATTDSAGQAQTMQLAALITDDKGQLSSSPPSSTPTNGSGSDGQTPGSTGKLLLLAWPFYMIIALMTTSFWLGEKREFALVSVKSSTHKRHS